MEFQTLPFGVGEIGGVAPFHAQERTSSTYPLTFPDSLSRETVWKIKTDPILKAHEQAYRD